MTIPKFNRSACAECSTPLKLMYPCNDPEQGPREWLCPNGCVTGQKCSYCELVFHHEQVDGHDSFGNGIPEVDAEVAHYEAMISALEGPGPFVCGTKDCGAQVPRAFMLCEECQRSYDEAMSDPLIHDATDDLPPSRRLMH